MLLATPFALVALAAGQDSAAVPPAQPQWRELDRVVAIVNQDIITSRQLARDLELERRIRSINNDSELQSATNRILTENVKTRLGVQAGQDLGADERIVERNVQDRIDRTIEDRNGVVALSKILEQDGLTVTELKQHWREQLYSTLWSESITGEGTGIESRPIHDRYVRPGAIAFEYRNALQDPDGLRAMGGTHELFTLQTLNLDPILNGGPDKTLALARELQQRIRGGEDMADLVRHYSMAKERNGIGDPAELAQLQRLSPDVAQFAAQAKAGDVSDPILIAGKTGAFVQLVRLVERTPGVTPLLTSPEVQRTVAKEVLTDLDRYRLERAYARLYEAAYVWPEEFAARKSR